MGLQEASMQPEKKLNLKSSGALEAPLTYGFNLSSDFQCLKCDSMNFPLKHKEEPTKSFKTKAMAHCFRIYS